MTYLQAHRRPYQRRARAIAIGITCVVIAVIAIQLFLPHFFPAIFTTVARPFWRTEFSVGSGSLDSPESILAQNEDLKMQLADTAARMDTIRAIETENEELKNLLGRDSIIAEDVPTLSSSSPRSAHPSSTASKDIGKRILAAVLIRPPFSPYDELVIDIGHDHAISTSSMVYAAGGVLIGRVADVLSTTAIVRLLSSPGERYDVLIGSDDSPATAIGRGGGQYQAEISRNSGVKEGDFVKSPFLDDRPFGTVKTILSDPTQAFETVLFAPPVNIYQLRWVLVSK